MLTSYTAPKRASRIAALSLAVLMLLNAGLVAPVRAVPPDPAAVGNTVTWEANPKIASNVFRANFPSVTVDSNNITHIAYIMTPAEGANWQIMYTNNAGGSFNLAGTMVDTAGANPAAVPPAMILAGPGNVLHLIYVRFNLVGDNQLYYRQSTNNGATWSARVQISSGNKSAAPSMALDSAGNLHIVWINDQCGNSIYNVFYRVRSASGTLSGISKPKDECGTFQNRPQISIANGKPQVVFARDTSANGEIYYARLEGSQWLSQNISQSPGATSQNPAFASDGGNNLFAAWDENINGNTNHEIYFKTSSDGGLNWSSAIDMSSGSSSVSTQPNVQWSSTTQHAYVVWSDANNGSQEEIWEREFDPITKITSDAFQVSKTSGRSFWPAAGFGPQRADIAWHDNTTGNYQIYDLGGQLVGGGGGCTGTLTLTGKPVVKGNQINGTLTRSAAECTKMQVSLDAHVSDTTPQVDFSATLPPISVAAGSGCSHTVYVRLLKDGTTPGTEFSDSIKVDSSVDATVVAVNPNMAGLPTIYNQRITPADAYAGGAKDGDPRYTRVRKFFLGVTDDGDCAGLKEFSAAQTGEPVTTIAASGFAGSPALPGSASPGSRMVTVMVTDTLGTGQAFSSPLIYDPADTDPSETVSNTAGLPVLATAQNPTVTAPSSTDTILISLSFSNIHVNDNLYGSQGENLPAGSQFWGVWVANSPTDIGADSPLLNWIPISVPNPGPTFSIQWDLFSGIDTAADRRAGAYFVYVRFLDGAGNPSAESLKTQITLSSPFSAPTIYGPLIRR
jgi:hypothetical protein